MISEILKKFDEWFGLYPGVATKLDTQEDLILVKDNIKNWWESSLKALLESLVSELEGEKKDESLITEENATGVSEIVKLNFRTYNSALNLAKEKLRKLIE